MKQRVKEMEEEARKLQEMQSQVCCFVSYYFFVLFFLFCFAVVQSEAALH